MRKKNFLFFENLKISVTEQVRVKRGKKKATSSPVLRVSLGGSSLTGMTVTEMVKGRLRRSIS